MKKRSLVYWYGIGLIAVLVAAAVKASGDGAAEPARVVAALVFFLVAIPLVKMRHDTLQEARRKRREKS